MYVQCIMSFMVSRGFEGRGMDHPGIDDHYYCLQHNDIMADLSSIVLLFVVNTLNVIPS